MGCATCSNNSGTGVPGGCKSNGSCQTSGCNKLEVFDWLSNIELPSGKTPFNVVEIRFKNGRKNYFQNLNEFTLSIGDTVVTQTTPGYDLGIVSLTGELVKTQLKRKKIKEKPHDLKKIYRKATEEDLEIWIDARKRENEMLHATRKLVIELKMDMKLTDVEIQGDGKKSTFYYTAEGRVDFRELIKRMAGEFKIRVEMKQIGSRQEAGRLGGIGSCGRELCCSTWLTDFRSVSTSAARYQQLSLNPQKMAGQCGKLKCCLNFELDSYMDALKDFPDTRKKIETQNGRAYHIKSDIFKRMMWYQMERKEGDLAFGKIIALTVDRVNELLEQNKKGEKAGDLNDYAIAEKEEPKDDYENVVGQDDLTRFDNKFKKKSKKKRFSGKKRPENSNSNQKGENPRPKNKGVKKPFKPRNKSNQNQNKKKDA